MGRYLFAFSHHKGFGNNNFIAVARGGAGVILFNDRVWQPLAFFIFNHKLTLDLFQGIKPPVRVIDLFFNIHILPIWDFEGREIVNIPYAEEEELENQRKNGKWKDLKQNYTSRSCHVLSYLGLADSHEHTVRFWFSIRDQTIIIYDHTKDSAHLVFITHKAENLASRGHFKTSPDVFYPLSAIVAVVYIIVFHGYTKNQSLSSSSLERVLLFSGFLVKRRIMRMPAS